MLPCTAASSLDAVECSYRLRIRLSVGLGPNIDSSAAMVESPRTGERVEFLRDDGKVLEMELTWPRPGLRAAEHVHPEMEERYEVVAGRAAFPVGGVEREAGPGGGGGGGGGAGPPGRAGRRRPAAAPPRAGGGGRGGGGVPPAPAVARV